jgi:hypothetical protein
VSFEGDDGSTDVDILSFYVAKFGALHSGRKIFFKFQYTARADSLDLPHGFMSPAVEASVIVT